MPKKELCKNCGHEIVFVGKSEIYAVDYIHKARDFLQCTATISKNKYCGCANPEPQEVEKVGEWNLREAMERFVQAIENEHNKAIDQAKIDVLQMIRHSLKMRSSPHKTIDNKQYLITNRVLEVIDAEVNQFTKELKGGGEGD